MHIPHIIRFAVIAMLFATATASSQSTGIRTYCNPVDIDYRYNWEQEASGISYRSAADPVIVPWHGKYYLFATISGGWWRSPDLLHWEFVTPDVWPVDDNCAPAALAVRDTLYLFQSAVEARPVFASTNPDSGHLIVINPSLPPTPDAIGPWDPGVYHEETDDRWYMYWGSSNVYPIYGIELDRSKAFSYIGTARSLLHLDPVQHGWERFGQDHRDTIKPFIEGAWMTKHGSTYYLQYGAPGTEYNVYANGVYTAPSPLGPFTYAPYNPLSYKPGGFVQGAGHGNTFRDFHGNYWNTGTPWVAVNWNFERRIAMFPAGFDAGGQMFSNTRFGDFPHYLPTRQWTDRNELFTGWMLLSYAKKVIASSARDSFPPAAVTDENPRTFWVAASNTPDQWIVIDLAHVCEVRAVQVNFTDFRSDLFFTDERTRTRFTMSGSQDGKSWTRIADLSGETRDRANAYIELPKPVRARFIRYEHLSVSVPHVAISDIRVFGHGPGKPPRTPVGLTVRRDADRRNVFVSWKPVPGAVGYNVLWGIAPDKLYQTWQVFSDRELPLEIRALTTTTSYVFAVEAFNEKGVSKHSARVTCP